MELKDLIKKLYNLLFPVVESQGYELLDIEYLLDHGQWILRLYIDRSEVGVTIADCALVSNQVSTILDVEDLIQGKYNLEVSSPGIERPLRKLEDFNKYKGCLVKIKTYDKINDRKNYKGIIQEINGNTILINIEGEIYKIPQDQIYKARLINLEAFGGN